MNFKLLKSFFIYKLVSKSRKGHGIHSPFVYDLIEKVINKKIKSPEFSVIENLRKKLINSKKKIIVQDFGAGSKVFKSNNRKVKKIAKNTLKSKKFGMLFYRLVKYFNPENIIEIGTSFGITTLYLAKAYEYTKVYTIEGCPETSLIAKENFSSANVKNINLTIGNFNDELPKILNEVKNADFVFFDGNHKKIPTLNYFEMCLKFKNCNSVFIFDDIHLSDEMEEAWEIIKTNKEVSFTIDLFFSGIVFFRTGIEKQDFIINF